MIRNLLATTAIATLLATGAYAQSSTPTPSATGEEPAQPVQDGAATPDAGASTATQPDDSTAQDDATQPTEDTAQDSATQPVDSTAQGTTTTQPAEETAQGTTTTTESDAQAAQSDNPDVQGQLASNLIGSRVYNGTSDDAENIGEVNDIVIGKDGNAQFVVIGVGGFLGIGEKDVAIEYATLQWAERDGDMWLVIETSKEQLETQPAFDRTAYDPEAMAATEQQAANDAAMQPAGTTVTTVPTTTTEPADTATAPATTGEAMESEETVTTTEPAADAEQDMAAADTAEAPDAGATTTTTTTDTAQAPADDAQSTDQTQTAAIDRSTLQESDVSTIEAEEFIGTRVYGANEEQIGEIGDVVLTQDGQVDAVLVDVGGFLGLGEKQVAVGMDNLQFMEDGDGNRYLYTQFTQEQLEAQPAYDEATYAENRDSMRLTIEN